MQEPVQRISEWNKAGVAQHAVLSTRPILIESGRTDPRPAEATEPAHEAHDLFHDHRKLEIVSVIDVPLWDRAGWQGIGYLVIPGNTLCMALIFQDQEAAEAIFRRWRERFGPVGEHERLHIALVREIAGLPATHYRALVTSTPRDRGSQWQAMMTRSQTMEPSSNRWLDTFLEAYKREGRYLLAPAVVSADGPRFGLEIGLEKRALTVKRAADVGPNDVEYVLLASRDEARRR